MSDARQAGLGVLAALLSAVVIFGSMLLALTEGGQLVALLPTLTPTSSAFQQPSISATFSPTSTSTPVIAENCHPPEGWIVIEIPPGASLDDIAAAYGSTSQLIMEKNCLSSPTIWSGYFLFVPAPQFTATSTNTATNLPPTSTRAPATARPSVSCSPPPRSWVPYYVRRGDTLTAIGRTFGVSVPQLKAANCLRSNLIHPGQRLFVPNVPTLTPTLPAPSATQRPSLTPTQPVITIIPPSNTPTITPTPTVEEPPTATPTPTLPPPPPATPTNTPTPMTEPTMPVNSGSVP